MSPVSFATNLVRISDGAKLSRHFVLIGALSLGSFAGAQAHPLDSPETIYIDGVPCNGACQSYMTWSRKTREDNSGAAHTPAHSEDRKLRRAGIASAAATRRVTPLPPTKDAVLVLHEAHDQTAGLEYLVAIPEDHSLPATAPEAKMVTPEIQAAAPQAPAAALSSGEAIEKQILAATALAEHVTTASIPAGDEKRQVADNSGQTQSAAAGNDSAPPSNNTGKHDDTVTVSPPISPDLVVLILARTDITSISDLANKNIAIGDKQDQFRERIRTGIVAAGAPMVELRDGDASAIDRVVSGEQPAAILMLASPEAADGFPEIKGFRIFRVPLAPN
jgi:hypothetical protein